MAEMEEYAPGTFCWVDLATTDAEAAKSFYTELFGWTANDVPVGEAGMYTMLQKGGKHVCALYAMSGQMREQGIPPHWRSYVSVSSADESAEKAQELGGTVLKQPFDVLVVGRMAVVQDPMGATFALWEPMQHAGAELVGEPGTLCWNELYATDLEVGMKFYTGLFGWTVSKTTGAIGQEYIEFHNSGQPVAGTLQIRTEWGEVPPNWAVYFAVEDCDATLAKLKSLGGKVEVEPMVVKDVGKFAVVQDPQGGYFAVAELKAPPS
ncbi:MAG: VOC family protein [Phycisphaerales bacterium]|nr:MAG: VOC family protein [Phycisphaerales bacterium]